MVRKIPDPVEKLDFKNTLVMDSEKNTEPFRGLWYNMILERLEKKRKDAFSDDMAILYISFIAVWNFANKKIAKLDYKKFKKAMIESRVLFAKFDGEKLEDMSMDKLSEYRNDIIRLCKVISNVNGIEYVGATKIMHMRNPNVFVPIDRNISKYFLTKENKKILELNDEKFPESYFEFLKIVKARFQPLESFYRNHTEIRGVGGKRMTFARAVDLYNFLKAQELKNSDNRENTKS